MNRGQSNVVGVVLLIGVAVVSLGGLTAAIGAVVDESAARADVSRVATDLNAALDPVEATGEHRGRVSFVEGRLYTVERDLRVLNTSGPVAVVGVGGLVFEAGERRVAFVAGAISIGGSGGERLFVPPPITASRGDGGVLVVGAPRLDAAGLAVAGSGGVSTTLRTNVTHERVALAEGEYRVAVETEAPHAWESFFADRGASTTRRDFDGDGVESVVARFPGERTAYLVFHDLHLEVGDG